MSWPYFTILICKFICDYNTISYYLTCTVQVGQLREVSNKGHNAELKLFLEVELGLVII